MIDLFRPFVAPEARQAVYDLLIPQVTRESDAPAVDGRLYIGQGEHVDTFEGALKAFLVSQQDVLTTNSCTSALDLSLHLCGVGGRGLYNRSALSMRADLVISTPMTCTATNSPIVTRGGQIMWADVDPLTGLISPESVEECIDRAIKQGVVPNAIIAVDWGGQLADYPKLRQVAAKEDIPIIQDAAHSFGATVGSLGFMDTTRTSELWRGHYTCFSFQAIKTLTTGDGGALVCPSTEETERARLLRWYGLDRRSSQNYRCEQNISEVGYKYHMNDIAAVMGMANLPYVDLHLDRHRANANYYAATMHGLTGVIIPPVFRGGDVIDLDSPWWLMTLLVSDRDSFQVFMKTRNIETSPVHARNDVHEAFEDAAFEEDWNLPGVDFFAAHEVAIPVGWWLSTQDRDQVAMAVQDWARQHGRDLTPPHS